MKSFWPNKLTVTLNVNMRDIKIRRLNEIFSMDTFLFILRRYVCASFTSIYR